jgi:ribosomal protein S18 acetylase RimI-like enzyme
MPEVAIRRASPNDSDAHSCAGIEANTLGDSDLTVGEMRAVLSQPGQYTYLAEAETVCIGMLATFETPCLGGVRLELDMLGVAQAWRGRGVATAMVRMAISEGRMRGCTAFRAVVAAENDASRRVLVRCGLRVTPPRRHLFTRVFLGHSYVPYLPERWSERWLADLARTAEQEPDVDWRLHGHEGVLILDARGVPAARLALLRVDTMAYAGYWVERAWATGAGAGRIALLAAAEHAKRAHLDEVGILIPIGALLASAASGAGYSLIGDYDYMMAG